MRQRLKLKRVMRRWFSLVAVVTLVELLPKVDTAAVFQLKISQYRSDGTDARGSCCGGECPGVCPTYFKTCLTHVGRENPAGGAPIKKLDSKLGCSYGLFTTEVVGNNSLDNEILQNFTFEYPWQGQFRLIIDALYTLNTSELVVTDIPPSPSPSLTSSTTLSPTPGLFRRVGRRRRLFQLPGFGRHFGSGASEWFMDWARTVLEIPERWSTRRIGVMEINSRTSPPSVLSSGLIQRFTFKRQLSVDEKWQHWDAILDQPRAHMAIEFRVLCAEGFTGANCTQKCPGPGENNERFSCMSNGTKICETGWEGVECDRPICASNCSTTHGYCTLPGECKCRLGWDGETCENCVTMPGCMHGTCNKSFECNCKEGWDGFFCSRPMCSPDCHATRGYCDKPGECQCRFGWKSMNCDQCKPLPGCVNGYCNKPLECICHEGWTGIFCHIPICSPTCAPPRGHCVKPNECRCKVGWMGENCQRCFPYPGCKHGFCTQPWECRCEDGWGGKLCDEELTFCNDQNPCENGGTCVSRPTEEGSYQCQCPEQYGGRNCSAPARRIQFY